MNANNDLTTLNGVLLKGEVEHRSKIVNGVWQCVFSGIAYKDCIREIFDAKPKTLKAVNPFFEGEFDYSFKLISEFDGIVRFTLILRETSTDL